MNIHVYPENRLKITCVPNANAEQFSINVGNSDRDIGLHFNPRFKPGNIVLNSMKGGSWGEEVKESKFPFKPGQEFEMSITFTGDKFSIHLHDGQMLQFPNRLAAKEYDKVWTKGDVAMKAIHMQ